MYKVLILLAVFLQGIFGLDSSISNHEDILANNTIGESLVDGMSRSFLIFRHLKFLT